VLALALIHIEYAIMHLEVEFTRHAVEKMTARHVSESDVKLALKDPDSLFYDKENETFAVLKSIRNRYLLILYTRKNQTYRVVTVYFSTKIDKLISSKIRREAWVKIEKE
jgi:hypothetical protein